MPAPARLRAHSRHTVTAKASVLALGVLLASTACSGSPAAAPAAVRSAPAGPEAAVAVTAQPTPDLPPGTITLAFGGDVHFTERTAPRLNATPADPALGPMSKTVAAADFAMVNLETAITTRGAAEPKLYHFRTPPKALTALQASGVDAVSMANNHAVDYGPAGLADTLDAVHHAPIPVLGIGANEAEAYKPYVKNIRGVRLAVVAASQVMDLTNDKFRAGPRKPGIASALDQAKLIAAVKRAKAEADVVVVYLHWGTEGQSCPGPEQKSIAAKLSAAGGYGGGGYACARDAGVGDAGQVVRQLRPGEPALVRDVALPALQRQRDRDADDRSWQGREAGLRSCGGGRPGGSDAAVRGGGQVRHGPAGLPAGLRGPVPRATTLTPGAPPQTPGGLPTRPPVTRGWLVPGPGAPPQTPAGAPPPAPPFAPKGRSSSIAGQAEMPDAGQHQSF
ncbi:CapA family protein [Streptomyces xanthochromogenes]|uniref:CapA family protein n=1 Tax=Streptomyces xanthochromogenes TaxID=67384 RepID=UPI002F40DE19